MSGPAIKPGSIVRGPTLPEPVEILALVPFGDSLKLIGRGQQTGLDVFAASVKDGRS